VTHSDPERRKQIWWRWFLLLDALKVWCVKRLMCTNISLCMWPGVIGFLRGRCFVGRLKMTVVSLFLILSGLIPEPGIELPWTQKKWILLARNSQMIFRTMQWFLCVCVLFLLFVNVRYHSDTMSSPRKKWRDGRPEEFKIRTGFFGGWNPKVRKCYGETIEMKVDFCVKLTTKSTKADAKDQDQCSEIHRITW